MESNEAPVTETSGLYCQAWMTTGGTAGGSTKPLVVTSSQQHVQAYPTSHLVTSRSYTASKLTTGHVSEVFSESPSAMCIRAVPHENSESHIGHAVGNNASPQSKDIRNIDSNQPEYVQFINPSSDSRSHFASTPEAEKTETQSPSFQRNQSGSRIVTSSKNDDVLYCEIKDRDSNECCSDLTLTAMSDDGYSAAAREDVVVERDKLLQRVSRLTIEKQEIVYKLRSFVETNGRLHVELERAHAENADLRNKLQEIQSTLEWEQHEKTQLNAKLLELTSLQTLHSNEQHINQEQLPLNISKHTLDGSVVNTGNDYWFLSRKLLRY